MAAGAAISIRSLSSTITTGGTAQTAAAADNGRHYLLIHNVDAAEDLWFSLSGTAAVDGAGSVRIPAKSTYVFEANAVPVNAVSLIAATTGHKFTLWVG